MPEGLDGLVDIYVAAVGNVQAKAIALAEQVRDAMPFLRVVGHCGGGSFKNQLKRADKSGAMLALIVGESEAAEGSVTIKHLRRDEPQKNVPDSDIIGEIQALMDV